MQCFLLNVMPRVWLMQCSPNSLGSAQRVHRLPRPCPHIGYTHRDQLFSLQEHFIISVVDPRDGSALSAAPWPIQLSRDLLFQAGGTIWHPQPDLWSLHLWPLNGSLLFFPICSYSRAINWGKGLDRQVRICLVPTWFYPGTCPQF